MIMKQLIPPPSETHPDEPAPGPRSGSKQNGDLDNGSSNSLGAPAPAPQSFTVTRCADCGCARAQGNWYPVKDWGELAQFEIVNGLCPVCATLKNAANGITVGRRLILELQTVRYRIEAFTHTPPNPCEEFAEELTEMLAETERLASPLVRALSKTKLAQLLGGT